VSRPPAFDANLNPSRPLPRGLLSDIGLIALSTPGLLGERFVTSLNQFGTGAGAMITSPLFQLPLVAGRESTPRAVRQARWSPAGQERRGTVEHVYDICLLNSTEPFSKAACTVPLSKHVTALGPFATAAVATPRNSSSCCRFAPLTSTAPTICPTTTTLQRREGSVDTLEHHQIAAHIHHGDQAARFVLVGLCHGRRDRPLRPIERRSVTFH
jgi:hypothetical protein